MADTKISAITAAVDLTNMVLVGEALGINKSYPVALFDTKYQTSSANLTSWAAITRATGFDTLVATATSANLKAFITDETGSSGALVFANAPTITGIPVFSGIPSLTGGALSFPASQVASAGANDLDDYEEGTFTPALLSTGATFSYTTQTGLYTKIGRLVQFDIAIVLNTSGNTLSANAISITGLPFTSGSGAGIYPVRFHQTASSFILVYVRIAGTTMIFEGSFSAATSSASQLASNALCHPTNGTDLRVTGSYYV